MTTRLGGLTQLGSGLGKDCKVLVADVESMHIFPVGSKQSHSTIFAEPRSIVPMGTILYLNGKRTYKNAAADASTATQRSGVEEK